jgi:uncharacterized delta-60 repeat protein
VRLNTNGSLDTSFNGSGKAVIAATQGRDAPVDATFDAQGRLIIVGSSTNTSNGAVDTVVIRVTADGVLDTTFAGGKATQPSGPYNDYASSVTMLASGKILVAGDFVVNPANTTDTDFSLMRLNADGTLDTSFGNGGIVNLRPTGANDRIQQTLEQADGKILVNGWVNGHGNNGGEMIVARFNADGSVDGSFGAGGMVRIPLLDVDSRSQLLSIVNGKIVVAGASSFNTNYDANLVLARLNADGSFDTSFVPAPGGSLGATVKGDGIHPVVLDFNALVYDAELAARGSYGGATLSLARHGGASADDHFTGMGDVSFDANNLSVGGQVIGWVEQNGGTLTLHYNGNATQELVTRSLHGIAYTNSAASPANAVTIDWLFSDNNQSYQSFGPAMTGSGSTTVQLGVTTHDLVRSYTDPSRSADNQVLANVNFFSEVDGTARADTVSAANASAAARALMAEFKRGIKFELGAGDDTVTGSDYSDWFAPGSGTNRVDGGANAGNVFGGEGRDILIVYVRSEAEANAVSVTRLEAGMSGADADAFAAGYETKVVNGNEIDYIKNVENIDIHLWTDRNGNDVVDGGENGYLRSLDFRLHLDEVRVGTDPAKTADGRPLAGEFHFAWANGTKMSDVFNAATDISAPTRALMDQYQRGMYANLGAGNDTFTGTAYGDNIMAGTGVNRIDGGANLGKDPGGNPAHDYLNVYVGSAAAAKAVQAVALSAGMSGADLDAFKAGYVYKIDAGAEVDYVRGIEQVDVTIWNDANNNGIQDAGETSFAQRIGLAIDIGEVKPSASDPDIAEGGTPFSQFDNMAWINGTQFADTAVAPQLLSSDALARMTKYGRGISMDMHGGGDTVTGSQYCDNFVLGKGVNYLDGGGHQGSHVWGGSVDVLDIYVSSQAELDAVKLVALTGQLSGADAAAQAAGYQYKIVAGDEIDYVKNLQQYNVSIWVDKNGNGVRDYANDATTEVTGSVFLQIPDASQTVASLVGVPPAAPAV